jgi:hypothetical protein
MPRISRLLSAILLLPLLAAAQEPAKIDIRAGETVIVRVGSDGGAVVVSRDAAEPLPAYQAAALRQMVGTPIVQDVKSQPALDVRRNGASPEAPVRPNMLRITLRAVPASEGRGPDGDMLLTIDNGYEGATHYRATIIRSDRTTPTDVCSVAPRHRDYEHWPYRFDRMQLFDLRLAAWHEGDVVSCE